MPTFQISTEILSIPAGFAILVAFCGIVFVDWYVNLRKKN